MARRKFVAIGVSVFPLALVLASPAMAQDTKADAAEKASGYSGDAIIVTARRREENLQEVPISIAAISGEDLAKRAIYSETDLQTAVPGLVIRQNGGGNAFNYVIRGQSVDNFTNSPPAVLPYINEVQIVTHSSSPLYDMAGIQVLKGPQGTLFGRNSTGGATLFQTVQPTDVFEGYASARYGSYDKFNAEGAVNLPLNDSVKLRIAAQRSSGGAYVRDYFTGARFGDMDRNSIRASLTINPTDRLQNTTIIQYTDEDGTNTPNELFSVYGCGAKNGAIQLTTTVGCTLTAGIPSGAGFAAWRAANPGVYQGNIADAVALQRSLGPWVSLSNSTNYHKAKSEWLINTTQTDLSDDITVKNIFGYNKSKSDDGYDYDGSPFPYFEIWGDVQPNGKIKPVKGFELETRQISDELQVQGKALDGRLDYVVGFYYLNQRFQVVSNNSAFIFAGANSFPFRFTYTARTETESVAGFAQASYQLTDRLNVTGGLRYTWDKTEMVQLPDSLFVQAYGFAAGVPEKQNASKPSWNVSADYELTPDLRVYATTRGSWRSGSYNYSTPPVNAAAVQGGNAFAPETTYDVEFGVKYAGDDLGVPVTLNFDVYQQWVKDIQRAVYIVDAFGNVSLLTGNVPRAEITGVETDFSVKPTHYITFGGSVAYTDARYTKKTVILGYTDNPATPADESARVTYGPFADSPEWSGSLYGEFTMPLGDQTGDLTLRIDAYAQTEMYYSNVADTLNPDTILPSYELVNARLTWSGIMGTKVDFSIFGNNLFDKEYYTGGNAGQSGGLPNTVNPGLPQVWGAEARVKF